MRVLAICAGQRAALPKGAQSSSAQGAGTLSAIAKHAISTLDNPAAIPVNRLGVQGDEQADTALHGGPRQAVYLYPAEHYPFWNTVRMQARHTEALQPGALGENLLIEGLLEKQAWIGDVLQIGALELRIESPRSPCFKLNIHLGFSWAVKMMEQSGFTGFYCSVQCQASVAAGDKIIVRPGDRITSIDQAYRSRQRSGQKSLF